MEQKSHETKWHRLDNTANIFPVINNLQFSGVFRIGAVLCEDISPDLLEEALKLVLPHFEVFQVQMRTGIFWYYMETNLQPPCVESEEHYPCRYIKRYENNSYLFRTGYYQNKLYLEIFHALTDGFGAIQFMKELVAAYIRLAHPESFPEPASFPLEHTSNLCEDSYLKYYRKQKVKGYKKSKAYQVKQPILDYPQSSVIHAHLKISGLKAAASRYHASITQYLAAVLVYTIYQEYLCRESETTSSPEQSPFREFLRQNIEPFRNTKQKTDSICLNIPVNLRQFFPSETTMNFFSIALAQIQFEREHPYTFEEILELLTKDLKRQLDPIWLEQQVSYNVSNEKNLLIRLVPLPIKSLGVRFLYSRSARSFTTTLSNLGVIKMKPEYEPYIQNFHFIMGASEAQPVKCVAVSFRDEMIFTISSVWETDHLENAFFDQLRKDQIELRTEGNHTHQTAHVTPYPHVPHESRLFQLLSRWYLILALITGIGLTVYNFSHYHGMGWSILVDAGILYSGLTLRFSIRFNINPAARILGHTLSILILCIIADYIFGYGGWSANYGFPALIVSASVANIFLILYNSISWQSCFMFQILYAFFGLIFIPLWMLGIITQPLPGLIALIIALLIPAASIVSSPEKIQNEIRRRFHF